MALFPPVTPLNTRYSFETIYEVSFNSFSLSLAILLQHWLDDILWYLILTFYWILPIALHVQIGVTACSNCTSCSFEKSSYGKLFVNASDKIFIQLYSMWKHDSLKRTEISLVRRTTAKHELVFRVWPLFYKQGLELNAFKDELYSRVVSNSSKVPPQSQ
jgi:hypothetical protein